MCTVSSRIKRPEHETGHLYAVNTWSPYLQLAWCSSVRIRVPLFSYKHNAFTKELRTSSILKVSAPWSQLGRDLQLHYENSSACALKDKHDECNRMVPCHYVHRDDVGSSDVISNHWNVPVFGPCWRRQFSVVRDLMFSANKVTQYVTKRLVSPMSVGRGWELVCNGKYTSRT
jgi:hypothetical protein